METETLLQPAQSPCEVEAREGILLLLLLLTGRHTTERLGTVPYEPKIFLSSIGSAGPGTIPSTIIRTPLIL